MREVSSRTSLTWLQTWKFSQESVHPGSGRKFAQIKKPECVKLHKYTQFRNRRRGKEEVYLISGKSLAGKKLDVCYSLKLESQFRVAPCLDRKWVLLNGHVITFYSHIWSVLLQCVIKWITKLSGYISMKMCVFS